MTHILLTQVFFFSLPTQLKTAFSNSLVELKEDIFTKTKAKTTVNLRNMYVQEIYETRHIRKYFNEGT